MHHFTQESLSLVDHGQKSARHEVLQPSNEDEHAGRLHPYPAPLRTAAKHDRDNGTSMVTRQAFKSARPSFVSPLVYELPAATPPAERVSFEGQTTNARKMDLSGGKPDNSKRIANGSSLLGTIYQSRLFDLRPHSAEVIGFLAPSHVQSGDAFCSSIQGMDTVSQDREEFASLWLELQVFWKSMLRTQPNPIMQDSAKLATAVDLMTDIAAARLNFEVRNDSPPGLACLQIREFRRRLTLSHLWLTKCPAGSRQAPIMLCGCMVGLGQVKDKTALWSPLFKSGPEHKEARHFTVRDVACLLRLEDFMTFASKQIEEGVGRRPDDGSLVITVQNFMDEHVKKFFSEVYTIEDLKHAWIATLCESGFRMEVVTEVVALVDEAMASYGKKGRLQHREGCEAWEASGSQAFCGRSRDRKTEPTKRTWGEPKSAAVFGVLRKVTFTK